MSEAQCRKVCAEQLVSFDLFLVVVQELTRAINNKKKYFFIALKLNDEIKLICQNKKIIFI